MPGLLVFIHVQSPNKLFLTHFVLVVRLLQMRTFYVSCSIVHDTGKTAISPTVARSVWNAVWRRRLVDWWLVAQRARLYSRQRSSEEGEKQNGGWIDYRLSCVVVAFWKTEDCKIREVLWSVAGDELFFNTLVCLYLLDDHFGLVYVWSLASCCSCSNCCDCFGCVLAVEGTATDEYRFELQPSCEILCVYLLIQLFMGSSRQWWI